MNSHLSNLLKASLVMLLTLLAFKITTIIDFVHVGEPRASYNTYYRASLFFWTWLFLLFNKDRSDSGRFAWLSILAKGCAYGYLSAVLAYFSMLVASRLIDARPFPHVSALDVLVVLLHPLTSFVLLVGVIAFVIRRYLPWNLAPTI